MYRAFWILSELIQNQLVNVDYFTVDEWQSNVYTNLWIFIILLLLNICKPNLRKWLYILINGGFLILASAHYIYFQIFQKFLWVKDILLAKEGGEFLSDISSYFDVYLQKYLIVDLILMMVAFYFIHKMDNVVRTKKFIITNGLLIVLLASMIGSLKSTFDTTEVFQLWKQPRFNYDKFNDQNKAMELCGLYEYTMRDIKLSLFPESSIHNDDAIKDLDEYYNAKEEFKPNDKTGLFKGKNVVLLLMESIDDWMISETYTPVLYYMMNNGMNFTEFYAPIFGSGATFNSEFGVNTGFISPKNGNVVYSYGRNTFPNALANQFKEDGYTTNSYHFNRPDYYNRETMHENFGYEKYTSFYDYDDFNLVIQDSFMAKSDALYEDMTRDDKFFDFLITFSAHMPYDLTNSICVAQIERYPELYNDDLDEETNCAKLQAKETDELLRVLLTRLYDDGLLDNTVIIAFTDHYSYAFTDKDKLNNYSVEAGSSILEKVPFVIFDYETSSTNQQIHKVTKTIDILPTVSNLFGYQPSKYLLGKDAFDPNYKGYVYFSDNSWYDGETYYQSAEAEHNDSEYEVEMNIMINELIEINDKVLETNYLKNKDH